MASGPSAYDQHHIGDHRWPFILGGLVQAYGAPCADVNVLVGTNPLNRITRCSQIVILGAGVSVFSSDAIPSTRGFMYIEPVHTSHFSHA